MRNRTMLIGLVAAALLLAALTTYSTNSSKDQSPNQPRIERTAEVSHVIDGDTIALEDGEKVRLVGVNAPEMDNDPFGQEAKEFTEGFCPAGTEVGLDVDDLESKDRYGRTLAVVYVKVGGDWTNLNEELLRNGFAEVMFIPPSEFNPYVWASQD